MSSVLFPDITPISNTRKINCSFQNQLTGFDQILFSLDTFWRGEFYVGTSFDQGSMRLNVSTDLRNVSKTKSTPYRTPK